jgi:tryptophan-rich sensory protein
MNEKIRQTLVIIATIGVIFVNYLATTSQIGGVTPSYISEKYPTSITPAGYAFAIWGLIYLGMIAFSIYQALPSKTERFSKIRTFYILSCVANTTWIYVWHHEMLVASLLAMLTLLGSLALINIKLMDSETFAEKLLAKLPFSIYFGWVTVASILNITILLASFRHNNSPKGWNCRISFNDCLGSNRNRS